MNSNRDIYTIGALRCMGTTKNNEQVDGREIRFVIDIPGIMLFAYITERLLNEKEKQYIYALASFNNEVELQV